MKMGHILFSDPQQSPEVRKKRYECAQEHIKSQDFEKEDVQKTEIQAHKIENLGKPAI